MSWQHLREDIPIARKPHRCCLCGLNIGTGERYIRRVGDRDGTLESFAMHVACKAATMDWDATSWDTFDEADFRDEMERRKAEKNLDKPSPIRDNPRNPTPVT